MLPQQAPESVKPLAPQPAGGIAAYVMGLLVGILLLMAFAAYLGYYKGRGGALGPDTKPAGEKEHAPGAQGKGKAEDRGDDADGDTDDTDDVHDVDVDPTSAYNPTVIVIGNGKA